MHSIDEKYMKEAIRQARKAYAIGEVPIGCVIVYKDKIIGRGYNRRMADKNTLSHAELIAIRKASRKMGDWRLEECTMYVTLEPCQMCSGAIVQSRMSSGSWMHESQGRMCRIHPESAADDGIQPSGRIDNRRAGRRMQPDDEGLL